MVGICYHDNRWVSSMLYYLVIKQTVTGRRMKKIFVCKSEACARKKFITN